MITIDFESRSTADLIKWGQMRYAMDTSTQALCLAWVYDDEGTDADDVHLWHRSHPWIDASPRPDELIERIRDGEPVEAHNAGFEFWIWNEVLRREYPEFDVEIRLEQLYCSAAKASCLSLPRSLGDAVAALGLEHRKLADGRRLINKLSKPMARRKGTLSDGSFKTVIGAQLLAHREARRAAFKGTAEFSPERQFTTAWASGFADWAPKGFTRESAEAMIRDKIQRDLRDSRGYCKQEFPLTGLWYWTDEPLSPKDAATVEKYVHFTAEELASAPVLEPEFCEEEAEHRANWHYCQLDVLAERGLSNFCPEMTPREREYWLMDQRMNQRGILLDIKGANEALALAKIATDDLNRQLSEATNGAVEKGSQRKVLLKWANAKLEGLHAETLENSKANTLAFALTGAPTKAGDEAKAAALPAAEAKWKEISENEDIDTFDDTERVKRVLNICMEVNKTSIAKYKQMVLSVCPDDRLHDIMLYNGADRTGRWSGKGVQPHNFVRGYKDEMSEVWADLMDNPDIIPMLYGDETLVALAKACRGALIASPGKLLYAADFNAIEARKLAWLSNATKLLKTFQDKGDPYIVMAEAIYKRPLNKKENPNERNLGKKAILGLGYAMGWEKFQSSVWEEEGIWLEDEFCQEIVRVYRKDMYPEIPLLWKNAGNAAIDAVQKGGEHFCGGDEFGIGAVSYFVEGRFLHCRLPSGRLLAYLDPQVHTRVTYRFNAINSRGRPTTVNFPAKKTVNQHRVRYHAEQLAAKQGKRLLGDQPTSFLSPHLSFMGRNTFTRQWTRNGTHGGTLVENFDQASSRDLLAEAMLRIDQYDEIEGFGLLLSIHDEVIAEAPDGYCTLKEFEDMMSVVPDWAPGMPITAEGWIGERLRK